jgi:restriction endonuclease
MNNFLEKKLEEIQNMNNGACWYIVKQETSFVDLCYLVDFLQEYQNNLSNSNNLEQFIRNKAEQLNRTLNLNITTTHRALRVAVFYGLITNTRTYEQAHVTSVYNEIKQRCNGKFEDTYTYQDIIKRQIEKMFISSDIDEQYQDTRSDYRLYPVMLLYKILLELYLSGQESRISEFEYKYFVATTKIFKDFLDTLLLIQSLRQENDVNSVEEQFTRYGVKVDNRLILALKQLDTLDFNETGFIKLRSDKIKEVAEKLHIFEQNPSNFNKENYSQFLLSDKPLIILPNQTKAQNLLLYGVAGVGKSYKINKLLGNLDGENEHYIERVVFHPDYLNADFIGQILPTVKKESGITYEFKAGPFTRILKKAFDNPGNHYYLVIEEINRGNAPAIFGEIFQLLDRKSTGESEYKISHDLIAGYINNTLNKESNDGEQIPNENLKIHNNMIYIPNNLSIYATMNTADQNVFTLDTAFQRRWTMQIMENNIDECSFKDHMISDTGVTWGIFNKVFNDLILQSNKNTLSSEDKRLGAYFVKPHELMKQSDSTCLFAEKVIKYLWDDVFKFKKSELFRDNLDSLDQVLIEFNNGKGNKKFAIFIESVYQRLTDIQESHNKDAKEINPQPDTLAENE